MKKLILETPAGTPPHCKIWAKEAAQEMLSMFPEYKSSFQIEFDDCHPKNKSEISVAEYTALPNDELKSKYFKLPNGRYLVPYASEAWFLAVSSEQNKAKGINAVDMEHYARLKAEKMMRENSQDLVVTLLNQTIEPKFYGYGIEKLNSVLSLENCTDKELFITIFMHEFGHILNATHAARPHIKDNPDLGIHCTNDKCIMGESGFIGLTQERLDRKQKGQPPFCDECIASMRETLENMPGLVKAVTISHQNNLPVLPHNNDNWKDGWRQHLKAVAARENATYNEDLKNQNFVADITHADGSKLNIEANNEYNLSLGAQKANGEDDIPSIKDFSNIVSKAVKDNCQIEFANIEDDEFKARLLIACLESSPRVKTKGAPHISKEFLQNLDSKTKTRLQRALGPQNSNQGNNRPTNPRRRQTRPNNLPRGRGRS